MVSENLLKLGLSWNFLPGNGRMYGMMDGYLITMFEKDKQLVVFINGYLGGERGQRNRDELQDFLDTKRKKYDFTYTDVSPYGVVIATSYEGGVILKLGRILDEFIRWFVAHIPPETCSVSGREIEEYHGVRIQLGEFVYLCDAETARDILDGKTVLTDAVLPREQHPGNLLPGILGGLIGAIIVSVVWALIYMISPLTSFVGLIMGLFVSKGYEKLGGPKGLKKIITVSVISIVAVVFAQLLGTSVATLLELEVGFSFGKLWRIFESVGKVLFLGGVGFGSIIKEVLLSLIFMALGLFRVLRKDIMPKEKKETPEPIKVA